MNAPFDQDGADLVALAGGDRSAWGALYARHHAMMLNFLRKRVSLKQDVDEVHQRFWLKLPDASRTYDPAKGRGLAWMVGVLCKTLSDYNRHTSRFFNWLKRFEKKDRVEMMEWFPPSEEYLDEYPHLRAISEEEWRIYGLALQALNESDRETILLATLDLTSDECGEIVGCKGDAFRQRLCTALRRLRAEIARLGGK